jgi:hypothetical protein
MEFQDNRELLQGNAAVNWLIWQQNYSRRLKMKKLSALIFAMVMAASGNVFAAEAAAAGGAAGGGTAGATAGGAAAGGAATGAVATGAVVSTTAVVAGVAVAAAVVAVADNTSTTTHH